VSGVKWGAAAAVSALVISLLLGIISGVSGFYIFLRTLIFTVVFFGTGFGLRLLINTYFPELLVKNETVTGAEQAGSRIDITVDNTGEYAVPDLYKASGNSKEMGNIKDLNKIIKAAQTRGDNASSGQWFNPGSDDSGIDRMKKGSYNDDGTGDIFQETNTYESFTTGAAGKQTPSLDGLGGLPDLDTMATAFSGAQGASPAQPKSSPQADSSSEFVPLPIPGDTEFSTMSSMSGMFSTEDSKDSKPRNADSKSQALEGDFSPKDIAKGISSLLNKT